MLACASSRPARAQAVLVDRLVAVVGDQALTWRDVEAARLLGSIAPEGSAAEDIDRLITRELMHDEVGRIATGEPSGDAVDQRLAMARRRAGGPEAFRTALGALGLTEVSARSWVADDLRIEIYLDQRFTAAAQPTELEVAQAAARAAGRPATPEQLQEARRSLIAERRAALVGDWLSGIRGRTVVQIAGRP